jgi:hypothetical protein
MPGIVGIALPYVIKALGRGVDGVFGLRTAILAAVCGVAACILSWVCSFVFNYIWFSPAAIYREQQHIIAADKKMIQTLIETSAKKRSADEFKEQNVQNWLETLTSEEREFVRWLLHHGESDPSEFRRSGLDDRVSGSALNKGLHTGLVTSTPRGTGTAYKINENYSEALSAVLHP